MLANILRRLPSMGGSHYVEARRSDPELLAAMLDEDEDEDELPRWSPQGSDWTMTEELLAGLRDAVTALVAITAAHPIPEGGRKPTIPPPYPRPARPLDQARRERQIREAEEFEAEIEEAKARWRRAGGEGGGECVVVDHSD